MTLSPWGTRTGQIIGLLVRENELQTSEIADRLEISVHNAGVLLRRMRKSGRVTSREIDNGNPGKKPKAWSLTERYWREFDSADDYMEKIVGTHLERVIKGMEQVTP